MSIFLMSAVSEMRKNDTETLEKMKEAVKCNS